MWIAMITAWGLSAGAPYLPGKNLWRAFAEMNTPQHQSQECERPDPDESYCGFVNGACIYCPADMPHFCPSVEACFSSAAAAKSACGWTFLVCQKSK